MNQYRNVRRWGDFFNCKPLRRESGQWGRVRAHDSQRRQESEGRPQDHHVRESRQGSSRRGATKRWVPAPRGRRIKRWKKNEKTRSGGEGNTFGNWGKIIIKLRQENRGG